MRFSRRFLVRMLLPLVMAVSWFCFVVTGILASDWPQYGGPNRNGFSKETGLLREWPKDGPVLLWKVSDLGGGFSPVSVAGSRLYTLAMRDKDEFAIGLDRGTGKELWATRLGVSRESPAMSFLRQRQAVVDGDRVYVFTSEGHLICLEADAGRELWRKKYGEDFKGRSSVWGWSDNPLIDGNKLICTPGGPDAFVVALDKVSGKVIWKTILAANFTQPSHAPIVVAEVGGVRQYIQNTSRQLISVAASDGRLLWNYSRVSSPTANMAYVLVRDDHLFVTTGFGMGCARLRIIMEKDSARVEEIYFSRSFQNLYGGIVQIGDHIYAGHSGWGTNPTCVEANTGKIAWTERGPGAGPVATIAAEDRLYFRFSDGLTVLAEATPEGYREKGKFKQPERSKVAAWSLPVISHGRLFLRDQGLLYCYDLRKDSPLQQLRPPVKEPPMPRIEKEPPPILKDDPKRQPDAVFFPSPPVVVDRMLELARVGKNDVVYDLGCGDGRIVIRAAQKYGAKGIGVEMDGDCVKQARERVTENGLQDRVTIRQGDLFQEDLRDATVVALYLLPHLNVKLLPQLQKLRPGTRIVSHAFDIEGVVPDQVVRFRSKDGLTEHVLYVWTTPLKKK
jgi:outer membrane protein assembly factor BamB